MPFHVLLLPGHLSSRDQLVDDLSSRRSSEKKGKKDYLIRRHEFQKKKESRGKNNRFGAVGRGVSGSIVQDPEGGTDDENEPPLHSMASPLEIALAKCCERPGDDDKIESRSTPHIHRSRFHRPICPSNYDSASESMPMEDAELQLDNSRVVKKSPQKAGVLRRGQEGHFAALIAMFCPASAVGCRAMALAILQRTVAWEAMNDAEDVCARVENDQCNEGRNKSDDGNGIKSYESPLQPINNHDSLEGSRNNANGNDEESNDSRKLDLSKEGNCTPWDCSNDGVSDYSDAVDLKTGNIAVSKKEVFDDDERHMPSRRTEQNFIQADSAGQLVPSNSKSQSIKAKDCDIPEKVSPMVSADTTSTVSKSHKVKSVRIKSFLAAGGMKILARWLVEAFTPVPAPSNFVRSKPTSQQRGSPSSQLAPNEVAAPTGCLLLPLLHLLRSIPFDKDIVIASQINKFIRRLKKALDAVIQSIERRSNSDDSDGTKAAIQKRPLDREVHPIAGGSSVGKVLTAVERLMNTWKKAAVASDSYSSEVKEQKMSIAADLDPFRKIKDEIQSKFNDLANFQNGEGVPPSWLPKSVLGILTSPVSGRLLNANTYQVILANSKLEVDQNQPFTSKTEADEKMKKRTLEEILLKRNRDKQFMAGIAPKKMRVEELLSSDTKRVCWTDRPNRSGILPAPLTEERIFIKDPEYDVESTMNGDESLGRSDSIIIQIKEEDPDNSHDHCMKSH